MRRLTHQSRLAGFINPRRDPPHRGRRGFLAAGEPLKSRPMQMVRVSPFAPRPAWRGLSLAALVIAAGGLASGALAAPPVAQWPRLPRADVPIPQPRPMDLGEEPEDEAEEEGPAAAAQAAPVPPPVGSAPAAPAVAEALAPGDLPALCKALVEEKTILAERAPPVPVQDGCSLPVPVRISAVRLADGNLAALSPPAIMRCEAVAAVAQWVREDIGPAVAALGTRLETVRVADSYQCRTRNRRKGAQISEHGQGNAFDTYGFVLADGRALTVKGSQMPVDFQTDLKASACKRFTTVLGPGSDGYHEDHIHVDLAVRRLDIRLCKWNIKAPAPAQVARAEPKPGAPETAAKPAETSTQDAKADEDMPSAEGIPLPPRRPAGLGRSGG